ncbi:MAG: PocR ligand-binding domain-containing protein [Lachnospiraceae bacterium]
MERNNLKIDDVINLDEFQKLQDNWSKATGISFVTVNSNGEPFTKPSNFTKFCEELRKYPEYRKACYHCDACGGKKAKKEGKSYVYICHAGLIDYAIPITVEDKYMGAILAGQVKVEDKEDLKQIAVLSDGWKQHKNLVDLYEQIPVVSSLDKIRAIANTIFESYNYMIGKEYISKINIEKKEKKLKLIKEEKLRIEMEKSVKDIELRALHYQINPHFLFNVLNTIGRLAFFENAKMTEDVVYAFSDMMRYILKKSSSPICQLKDEVTHILNYFKIQKIRLGSRLNYEIDIPEELYEIKVPFMCLQPLVENSVKYAIEKKATNGNIWVKGYEKGEFIYLEVRDDGDGISQKRINEVMRGDLYKSMKESAVGLYNVNSRMVLIFGKEHEIKIDSPNRPNQGTKVTLKIPKKFSENKREYLKF